MLLKTPQSVAIKINWKSYKNTIKYLLNFYGKTTLVTCYFEKFFNKTHCALI
jgi:hypothetical protein